MKKRQWNTALVSVAICVGYSLGCSRGPRTTEASGKAPEAQKVEPQKAEPKSPEVRSVEPQVQSEIERMEAEKQKSLLKDAQSAIEDTSNALAALDRGDKKAALEALQRASGKLDLVISRDPKLALAPVGVTPVIHDLYATVDAVKTAVKDAKDDLSNNEVQEARHLLRDLASEFDINIAEVPLATYPAAIKAVVPLIDAGKIDQAKAALADALNTLVIDTYVIALPKIRAQAMLVEADDLAAKSGRTSEENATLRSLIDAARNDLQLAETLGYGNKERYKPLYAQLDEVQKKAESGQSGRGWFDKIQQSIRNFKFSS